MRAELPRNISTLQSFEFSTSQAAMDVETIFHMKGGIGETSYARNSSLQKKASDVAKHIALETVRDVYFSQNPASFGIADLGCSSGPNTLSIIKDIIEVVWRTSSNFCQRTPEFRVYLNDLPTNDFNSIFKALPDFCRELQREKNNGRLPIFIGGYPGSFYGRLFPNNCLHFVYSSYSLHWLSRIPVGLYNQELGKSMNKGSVYISESSPPWVSQAYLKQFQEDFSLFLRSRAEELIVGGRMVLILLGRRDSAHIDRGNSVFWRVLTRSFETLVSKKDRKRGIDVVLKGEIEREKLDSYDVHFYAPCREEIEEVVRKEGSFGLDLLEKCEIERTPVKGRESYGTAVAMAVRAIQESMISHHFGEEILDSLFETYAKILDEEMGKEEIRAISLVLVLRKL